MFEAIVIPGVALIVFVVWLMTPRPPSAKDAWKRR